jgi:DNA-binding transcriptional LysR family regulator
MLAEFCRQFPRIELKLSVSDRNEDMLNREADIAVRMMRPTQGALVTRLIGTVELGLYAHRRYVDAFGVPRSTLAMHRDARATRRIRLVFDHLAARLARYIKDAS